MHASTATVTAARVTGQARTGARGVVEVPVRVHTRLFGTITAYFSLPILNLPEGPRVKLVEVGSPSPACIPGRY